MASRRLDRRGSGSHQTTAGPEQTAREKWHHLYDNGRWRRMRADHLAAHPLCWYCEQAGRTVAANTADHIIPHRGDEALFWDPLNLRSACGPCHTHLASVKDHTGVIPGCNLEGEPLDPAHPWAAR